jgi:ParB-like chromosome segregation protein Spo0J
MTRYEDIAIAEIILEDDLQPRCGIDAVLVGEYADALAGGAVFPPVVVFREGSRLYLADGFHRLKAHQSLGKPEILCAVSSGS